MPLRSLSTAQSRAIRELSRDKKRRDADRSFVLEGAKAVRDLLATRRHLALSVVAAHDWLEQDHDLRTFLLDSEVPVYTCPQQVYETLSGLKAPPGVLAVVRQPAWDAEGLLGRQDLFGVYGEALQDPTNVGAIIRTAAALGADAVWLSGDSADNYNPKVVRASSAAVLHIPTFRLSDVSVLVAHGCTIITTEVAQRGTQPIRALTRKSPRTVVCLGNESRGLSASTIQTATYRLHIPIEPPVESLNVAATAAIALFYLQSIPVYRGLVEQRPAGSVGGKRLGRTPR